MAWNPFKKKQQDGFQRELQAAAQRKGLELKEVGADDAVLLVDGQSSRISLYSLRLKTRTLEEKQLPPVLDGFLDAVQRGMRDDRKAREVLDRIRPVLFPWIAFPGRAQERERRLAQVELFPGFVNAHLVAEEPSRTWYLADHHLEEWRVPFDELYRQAIENLRGRSDPGRLTSFADAPVPGIYRYQSDDAFAASRVLVLGHLLQPMPESGALVMVPSAEVLLCLPMQAADSVAALNPMLLAGRALHRDATTPISDQPFWFDGKSWHHVPARHRRGAVEVEPPDPFVRALERLAKTQRPLLPG